jgi:prepilin signal peptidase PulO-like enzyme (type II secretory pathway)
MIDYIYMITSLITGWLFGAGINYLADVLPLYRKLSRSACDYCSQPLTINHYVLLQPCQACGGKVKTRHFWVNAICLIVFTMIAYFNNNQPFYALQNQVIFAFFVLVTVIDIEHHLILHPISLTGALLLGGVGIFHHGVTKTLLGGLVGFSAMLVLYLIGIWFAKILSAKRGTSVEEGLGFGDVTLATVSGLLLGYPGISLGLFASILLGGAYSAVLLISTIVKKEYSPYRTIPYGPFIALAVFVLWMISSA